MFQLKFDTENEAFDGHKNQEIARILRDIAKRVEQGECFDHFITVFDINGNDVGRVKID